MHVEGRAVDKRDGSCPVPAQVTQPSKSHRTERRSRWAVKFVLPPYPNWRQSRHADPGYGAQLLPGFARLGILSLDFLGRFLRRILGRGSLRPAAGLRRTAQPNHASFPTTKQRQTVPQIVMRHRLGPMRISGVNCASLGQTRRLRHAAIW